MATPTRGFASLSVALVASAAVVGCGSSHSNASYWRSPAIAQTPSAAAELRLDKYLAQNRQFTRIYSSVKSTGKCVLLHRRPWVAYSCPFDEVSTDGKTCRASLVVAVKPHDSRFLGVAEANKPRGPNSGC